MNIVDVVSIGITIMAFSLIPSVGAVLIFFAIAWWIYHLAISKNPEMSSLKNKTIIIACLFVTYIELYLIYSSLVSFVSY